MSLYDTMLLFWNGIYFVVESDIILFMGIGLIFVMTNDNIMIMKLFMLIFPSKLFLNNDFIA